jgi:hypothetical protein
MNLAKLIKHSSHNLLLSSPLAHSISYLLFSLPHASPNLHIQYPADGQAATIVSPILVCVHGGGSDWLISSLLVGLRGIGRRILAVGRLSAVGRSVIPVISKYKINNTATV